MKNRILALLLTLCLCLPMSVGASAAEIDTSGGSATTPVLLTTTNDGVDGKVTPSVTKMSVTVPTAFPMAMSDSGTVVTATDCKIINNSYGSVRVRTVTISSADGWHLTDYGDKDSLASEKVDANKLGFAIRLGDGYTVCTTDRGDTQALISTPLDGCYMTGAGDPDGNSITVAYDAIVTPLSGSVQSATIANVVFVIEWNV